MLQVFLVFFAVGLVPLNASLATDAVTRLERFFKDTHSLSGRFSQTVVDEEGKVLQQSRGRVKLLRPGRFIWGYDEPYEQMIIADGEFLWVYDKDLAQVTQHNLHEALATAPVMLLSEQHVLKDAFTIETAEQRGGLDWITLSPKENDSDFTRVQIAFAEDGLKQMVLYDQFGQQTLIRFLALTTDQALPPEDFVFKPPKGVDVIR